MIIYLHLFAISIICFIINLTIVKTRKKHLHITGDTNIGPQKIHKTKTPRIGGIAIYITLVIALIIFNFISHDHKDFVFNYLSNIIIISLPVIIIGLAEDLYKDISILGRFLTSIFVGVIAYFYDVNLSDTNIKIIDEFLYSYNFMPLLIIMFFAGSINSLNMIDGVNGLAGLTSIVILTTLYLLALENNDYDKYYFTLLIIGTILGFLFINWFTGSIFLGDSGAYLLGTILAFVTCKILYDNNLSIFNILTLFSYPIWEILNSIIRRIYNNQKIIIADNKHLHSLVYILVANIFKFEKPILKNSLTTIFLIPFIIVGPIVTLFLYKDPKLLIFSFVIICVFSTLVYAHLCNRLKQG